MFFVATAPSALDGHVNVSPKGGDSFRVLGPLEVVYQDFTGSGAETAAHARETGRIVVMFCAFEGPPKIVRIHGHATLITIEDPRYADFTELFPANPGIRTFIHIRVDRISDSCGYSVPLYQFQRQRATLDRWASAKTPEGLKAYRAAKNRQSIDGLPALLPDASTTKVEPLTESKPRSATLLNSTAVLLVGNIGAIMVWCERIGFESSYFPPGFCILRRDAVQIFVQQQDGYAKMEDPAAHERAEVRQRWVQSAVLGSQHGGGYEITELGAGGPPLGLFLKIQCEETNLELLPGDVMVAFTDGVPEALNAEGEEFGEERLKELLRASYACAAEAISARISSEVRDWMGVTEQHDDVTIVVMKV